MKRIIREMSRGNSIIASVVLIGILGTLSIALQATIPSTRTVAVIPESQSALGVTTANAVRGATEASTPQSIECFEGVQYKVQNVKGDVKVSCQVLSPGECRFSIEQDRYNKAGAAGCFATLSNSNQKSGNQGVGCRPLSSTECSLQQCFAVKGGQKCVPVKGNFTAGQGFAPANNEAFAMRELVRQAALGDTSAQAALKELGAIDQTTNEGLSRAFADVIEEQKDAIKNAHPDAACVSQCDSSDLGAQWKAYEDEQKRLKDLQGMQKLNDDLKKVASIDPTKNPDTKTPPFNPEPKGPGGGGGGADKTGGGGGGGGGQKPPTTGFGQPSGSGAQQKPASSGAATSDPYQQCYPQYFCTNNTLYWGSPQSQQQASYYPYYGSGCQNQTVQYCQYGCAQGGSACSQNPQNTGQMPVATLSCGGNSVRDVGASVPITFSCTNATASAGSGFSTGGALSGSASTTIQKPPAGANTVSYGLTCTASNNQTASARCDVGINVTSIVIVANPKQVTRNASTTIGWVTKGMKECVIQADNASDNAALGSFNTDNAGNTAVSGVATTPGLIADTTFTLTCKTQAGQNKNAAVTVKVQ